MADTKDPEHPHRKERYGRNFNPSNPPADAPRFDVLKRAKCRKPAKAIH
jgi:hypothetical protein